MLKPAWQNKLTRSYYGP